MKSLLWLGDPKSFDAGLVGGKAANLSRLAHLYHRVPDGFSLPVANYSVPHYKRWQRSNRIGPE
jgi:phosphoenolpyruvate synthase/pyruvate phosphate dikinase